VSTLRLIFHLALRQAEGFIRSVLRLLGLHLSVPDHATLSRRGSGFAGRGPRVPATGGAIHVVLDSTDLEAFGQGEWNASKHGRTRRKWRKLHVAVDVNTGETTAHILTDGNADDAAQVPALLNQTEGQIASVTADGAYDIDAVYQEAAVRQRHPPPAVVIPPRASAVLSIDIAAAQSPRDRHIAIIADKDGLAEADWCGRRNQVETAIGRYKHLIGCACSVRATREALIVVWEASDQICGKRLRPLMPILIPAMEKHGHLHLNMITKRRSLHTAPWSFLNDAWSRPKPGSVPMTPST
jgi:hypothetical protein